MSAVSQIDELARQECRRAARALLMHPLLTPELPDPSFLPLVRRHAKPLTEWFGEHLGYRLVVEAELARLYKVPPPFPRDRRPATPTGHACSPRHYSLLCLLLAALDGVESQTTLTRLAEKVKLETLADPELQVLDLDDRRDRRVFVEAVRLAAERGCLEFRDGDEEGYVTGVGDALYDVFPSRLTHLLVARIPPAGASGPDDLVTDAYPDTDDGRRRRIRHRLMRQLCEEPVLYHDDLSPAEFDYLRSQRAFLARQTREMLGLEFEARAEGVACIDPDGDLTDLPFPGSGTYPHGALLLAEALAARVRASGDARVAHDEISHIVAGLVERFGRYWRAEVRDGDAGIGRMTAACLGRLGDLGLIESDDDGVVVRPAIARFAINVLEPDDPSESGAGVNR